MQKRLHVAALCSCVAAALSAAGATVSGVGFSQDPSTGKATVSYSIDEPAIVTVDVRTNRGDGVYASIGADKLRHVSGEVNKLVTNVNESVSASWPLGSMPEQSIGAARVVVSAWSTNAPPNYMAISMVDPEVVRYYVSADAFPLPVTNRAYKTDWLVMRRIPAAGVSWHMGYPDRNDHVVSLSEDFYIGIYEFTIGQWLRSGLVKISTTSYVVANEQLPASSTNYGFLRGTVEEGINWPTTGHAVKSGSPIDVFRTQLGIYVDLPTEAQWEYACRAGTGTETYNGCANSQELAATNGWFGLSNWLQMGTVGHFIPNPWGLYDMYGGMLEWCLDWYDETADLGQLESVDPKGVTSSPIGKRVQRSSGWNDVYSRLFSNFRTCLAPENAYATVGFRLVAPCRAPLKAK